MNELSLKKIIKKIKLNRSNWIKLNPKFDGYEHPKKFLKDMEQYE